jgi:hypothetical protein
VESAFNPLTGIFISSQDKYIPSRTASLRLGKTFPALLPRGTHFQIHKIPIWNIWKRFLPSFLQILYRSFSVPVTQHLSCLHYSSKVIFIYYGLSNLQKNVFVTMIRLSSKETRKQRVNAKVTAMNDVLKCYVSLQLLHHLWVTQFR